MILEWEVTIFNPNLVEEVVEVESNILSLLRRYSEISKKPVTFRYLAI